MNDISAVVLHKIISEGNIDAWAKLRSAFLHPSLDILYRAINRHYEKFSKIPSFEELKLEFRDGNLRRIVQSLETVSAEDIDTEVAVDALINEYTQSEALKLLSSYLDKLPLMDCTEVKENLSGIVLKLDEKVYSDEKVITMDNYEFFRDENEYLSSRAYLGISNKFDAEVGAYREELILIGGRRGAGKSIICSNIQVSQYEQGNVCPYFTIEMTHREVMDRNMAILSGVSHSNIRKRETSVEEDEKLAYHRSLMFADGIQHYEKFLQHRDKRKLEHDLMKYATLKEDGQLIVIDDRRLTLSTVDLHVGKLKAKYGDKLVVVVLDYLNQIASAGKHGSMYEWIPQMEVAKGLKNLSRKHEVTFVSPYQIDASGEARMAKGILDAADVAMTLAREEDAIIFDLTKIRGAPTMKFANKVDWKTLRIDPEEIPMPEPQEKGKKAKSEKKDDSEADIT